MENQAAVAVKEKKASLFSIKPYGDNLCTPGAGYWISCIRLVIVVMALSEAIAWAYLGSLFGKGMVGYVAAAIAFLFVFIIIWIIDVSFVTLDMSKAHYDNEILKKKTSSWLDTLKISTGLIGRVAIVVVSLSISAPFIAQIVFMQDIDNEMEGRNLARVSVVSDSLIAQKDTEVAMLDSLILEREQELIVETAGQGASGNYGFGPVTQAMERNIQRLKDERSARIAEKEEMVDAFAALSIEEFAQRYNVDLVDNGVQARGAILNSLSQNPEYKTAKRAITAFLAFIFAALVLLKLFQPRSVRIYYNEKLQDLYREYLSGNLNRWISKEEQLLEDGRSQISPLRFEDWSINTYGVIRSEDIKRRESSKMYNSFKMKIEQLEDEKEEVQKMLDPIAEEYDQLETELNGLRIDVMKADNAVEQNERVAEDVRRQLASINKDLLDGSFKGQDLAHVMQAKKSTEDRLAQHAEAALELKYDQDIANHKYDIKKENVDQLEELISKVRANYRYIQEKIDEERLKYTELIVSGQIISRDHVEMPVNELQEATESESDQPEESQTETRQAIVAPMPFVVDGSMVDKNKEAEDIEDQQDEELVKDDTIEDPFENRFDDQVEEDLLAHDQDDEDMLDDARAEESNSQQDVELFEEGQSVEWRDEEENVEIPQDENDPFVDPYTREYDNEEAMYDDIDLDEDPERQENDQEMINRFIWEDEEETDDPELGGDEDEEEASPENKEKSYTHYPLLIGGMEKEKEEDSPIDYVDNSQLKRYADSASMAAYEASNGFDESEKYNESDLESVEGKSAHSIEVFSPDSFQDEPEEMEVDTSESYPEDRDQEPPYFWDDMKSEAAGLSEDLDEPKRTTYAWDALESANPFQRETERDEIVEERAEEEDQSADTTNIGEAEASEDIPDNDKPEASNTGARDPQPRRKVVLKRRLGRTGDWMIG